MEFPWVLVFSFWSWNFQGVSNSFAKTAFLSPVCRLAWVMLKMKNNFFLAEKKSRPSVFKNFLFYQNIICFGWVMKFFLFCDVFLSKKGHSQLKQLCQSYIATTRRHSCSNKSLGSQGDIQNLQDTAIVGYKITKRVPCLQDKIEPQQVTQKSTMKRGYFNQISLKKFIYSSIPCSGCFSFCT